MRGNHVPILVFVAGAVLGVSLFAPLTWLVLLTDGLLPLALLGAAAGWGAWPAAWLGFGRRSSGQQLCIGVALGLGLLSGFTLILGVGGLLNRPIAWVLLATGGVLGLARLYLAQAATRRDAPPFARPGAVHLGLYALFALLLAVPLVVALFGASLPPGMLWQAEANGYDVLEYHLQAPREYYQAGRIAYLPHNVYASFPQQMEMLYLLLMQVAGGAYSAAVPAQLLHACCGILAVGVLGCWTSSGWGRWLVVALAGSTPWLAYLGCLAYVENGMLFFAAVAAGLAGEQYRNDADHRWRLALTAGVCAGLAGGCKYTAIVFVTLGLALAVFVTTRASLKLRTQRLVVFGLGALLALSPWLVRNVAFTGNPVYPFAYAWLGGADWSAEQARQWSVGHRVQAEHDSLAGRLTLAARELLGRVEPERGASRSASWLTRTGFHPTLFGQVLFVLAAAGAILGRSRRAAMLMLWSGWILIGWIGLTFVPGRFAVPLIVPLALLAGDVAGEVGSASAGVPRTWWKWPVVLIALAGACANDLALVGRLRDHERRWTARSGVPMRLLPGQTEIFVSGNLLNRTLPADSRAWLVGDAAVFYVNRQIHYTVPFSRDPWLEFAAAAGPRESLDWLRSRNVSHVVFAWSEIERLRGTYGFSELVTRGWVAGLERAGLRRVEIEAPPPTGVSITVYEVLPHAAGQSRPGRHDRQVSARIRDSAPAGRA